ncbi:MAG: hypothetical protein ACKO96_41490 [Flammeovirgaceae bacterium]
MVIKSTFKFSLLAVLLAMGCSVLAQNVRGDLPRKNRVTPRSASRPFVTAPKKNVYWGKFRKGEKPYTKDIAGKSLRTRNQKSPPPVFQAAPNAYKAKRLKGRDRPYNGTFTSGYATATKKGEQAWNGDIAGMPLGETSSGRKTENVGVRLGSRKLSLSKKRRGISKPLPGSGYQTESKHGEDKPLQAILPTKIPLELGVGSFSGDTKLREAEHLFVSQGEGHKGKFKRNFSYTPKPNSSKRALKKKEPQDVWFAAEGLQAEMKRGYAYTRSPKSNKRSLKKQEPSNTVLLASTLPVAEKRDYGYVQHPRSNKRSLKKQEPQDVWFAAEGLQPEIRRDYGYFQSPYSVKKALKKKEPSNLIMYLDGMQVPVKLNYKYIQNPRANLNSLKKREPKDGMFAVEGLQVKVKQRWALKHNPSSNQSALDVHTPNAVFSKANTFQGRVRLTRNYIHNPKSDKDALKVLAPGRAFAKINNYQGNVKMSKPSGKNLHPDSKFAHGNRNNVENERTFLMNVKLWWAKLFKKNDNQTEAVKEKVRKPRYDKKEKELWKDLYD